MAGMANNTSLLLDNSTVGMEDDSHHPKCLLFKFLLYVVAMGIMCLLGFAGNTVSFMVLHKDRSTPVASFLLKSLAVADNIFLLLWVMQYSVRYVLEFFEVPTDEFHVTWIYVRVFSFPVLYMAQTLTIWLTVVIALNRFMAVCLPYKAPHLCNIHNVYKEVAVVTLFSIVYNIPRFFEIKVVGDWSQPSWNRTSLGWNDTYQKVYTDGLYYLFSFVLPLLILAFVNTRVIIAYQATQKRKRRMSTRRSDNENNITLVMIMVVVIFMLCQAPARIVQAVWSYRFNHCHEFQFYLIHISNTLEVLNSSVNFLIYCIFHKRFRDILYASYCCGPLGEWAGRRDSQRFTTTEGLSLEEANVTMSASRKSNSKTSSSKGSGDRCDQSRNGSVRGQVTAAVVNQQGSPVVQVVKEPECYRDSSSASPGGGGEALRPLRDAEEANGPTTGEPLQEEAMDDDVTQPLTPCK